MITCLEINSRAIGNALYEYATLFGVGCRLNLDIRIPKGENHIHQPTGQKIWQLKEIFDIKTPYITEDELKNIKYTYTEKHKGFNSEIFDEVIDNTNLVGFFQNENYFNHCENELRKQLIFKKDWVYEAFNQFSKLGIDPQKSIAIHVRRKDYTKLPEFHPVLPMSYYFNALNYLNSELVKKDDSIRNYDILVFSDDINSCKLDFGDNFKFIENEGETSNIVDLVMYSLCSHYILANSTYGLWGAWLGDSKKEKVIIAPRLWFGPGYSFGGQEIAWQRCIKV